MYLLDTSFLVTAHRSNYPFEYFPSFWIYLLELFETKVVFLPQEVLNEITINNDELSDWVQCNLDKITVISPKSNIDILKSYGIVINHVNSYSHCFPSAIASFAGCADSWIIAQALALGYIVVSSETSARGSKKNIKIPDVCDDLNIKNLNLIQFIKEVKFRI